MNVQATAAVWLRVSTSHQEADNQVPDVETLLHITGMRSRPGTRSASRHGTAARTPGSTAAPLARALDDVHAGEFSVLVVWALDRITREGAEDALRIIRQFRQRGCTVVSVKESWLNAAPEVQDVLVAFAGWMAQQESRRRSERIRAGLARRRAEGKPVGRQPGSTDKRPRKRSGYVASWEGGRRRAAHDARTAPQ
jgi:putative DNA-invertase from lambdoid prophage Rac